MNIIFVLLPLSIVLGCIFLGAYIWSVRSRQYEDLTTPALRMLMDKDINIKEDKRGKN